MTQRPKEVIARIWAGHRILAIAVAAIVVVAIIATSVLIATRPGGTAQATPSQTPVPTDSPSPSPSDSPTELATFSGPTALPAGWVYSDLDGVGAPPDTAHRLPMAIMVDDNSIARPQSGISSASIVYQAYADGGEDRYMFVFQEGTAKDIGPVRSARPYFVYWAAEYKALLGHYGGDANSLQRVIPAMANNIYNEDALNGGLCPFRRITTRQAPHNAYTTSANLISCLPARKYPTTYQSLPTRPFRDDTPADQRPAAQSILIPYRTYPTGIGYKYDPTTDSYLRLIDGTPEVDPANGNQVFASTVVVLYQPYGNDPNAMDEASRPYVFNEGSGKATVFMEGVAITATWKKTSHTALTRLYDSSGNEIPLVRGEIFMQSIPPGTTVTVK